MDTIFALASAPGRAGVSVIRISGPAALASASSLAGDLPPARTAATRMLRDHTGSRIDHALVLVFLGPNSFTGEDVVELHLHGSIAIVRIVQSLLSHMTGVRMAEAGEFTRRALENGKLDLTQVEGLADLIDAETEAQRRQALRVLSGDLGERVEQWRTDLIRAAALLEATIDFADEDVPVDVTPEVTDLLTKVLQAVTAEIKGTHVAERVRSGFEVAILGAPNVGKSTLLNYLAGRDAAITSEIAGTTRDVIEVRMDLNGLPVTFLDTAGLRDSTDAIEKIGIERALERANAADLRIFLAADPADLPIQPRSDDIILRPKADLCDRAENSISGQSGYGVDALIERLQKTLQNRTADIGIATRERHRTALQKAAVSLQAAAMIVAHGPESYDLAADDLRTATRALEALVGRIDVENLLDEIFTSFCVGK